MDLGSIGVMLLKRYSEVLKIPKRLAEEIINRNIFAYKFITDENCLVLGSKEENLNLLLAITLHRKDYDREPLKAEEVKILEDTYNIIFRRTFNRSNNYEKKVLTTLRVLFYQLKKEEITQEEREKSIAEEAAASGINCKNTSTNWDEFTN